MENLLNKYPQNLKDIVNEDQSTEKRLFAAKGLLPLPPSDLVMVFYALCFDENEEIKNAAKQSLVELPENVMLGILSDVNTLPEIMDYVSKNIDNSEYNQAILLNQSTYDETFIYLAEYEDSATNLGIIASNKLRILRSIEIVDALSNNPALSRSIMDEVISFLLLHLNKSDDIKDFVKNLSTDSEEISESDEIYDEDLPIESFFDDVDLPDNFLEELDGEGEFSEKDEEGNNLQEIGKETIAQTIQKMNIAEKLKTALLGNSEARRILIRDPNKIISNAVLRNPRISDNEVITITQSKLVDDEILRQIAETKKWAKLYQVKLSLVNNPKTPSHVSLNLIRHLREHDIKALMFNKNLPGVITTSARNIYKTSKK